MLRGGQAPGQVFETRDHRGTPVLALALPVAGEPWWLVTQIGLREALAPAWVRVGWLAIFALTALTAMVLLARYLVARQTLQATQAIADVQREQLADGTAELRAVNAQLAEAERFVRTLVDALEGAVIDLLAARGIAACAKPDAPGVYVDGSKIASLGLRVRRGRCYHGLAVNIDMDLAPFRRINPCGYAGLQMTQLSELCDDFAIQKATDELLHHLASRLGFADPLPLSELPTALSEDA